MPRASGKTTLLIKESAKTGRPIIEPNTASARYVEEQAKEMGLNIPEPIAASQFELWRGRYNCIDEFLIDEVDSVLANIFDKRIGTATYTPKEMEELNNMNKTATSVSSSSVCDINSSITTNVGRTAMNIHTSTKAEKAIDLGEGFQITNEGLSYDLSWQNTHYSPISASFLTAEKGWTSEQIWDINVIVPEKVVEITFCDMKKEKMVCHKDDTFDLRKCCFIAIAKHLYKKEYTQEGIEYMAAQLTYQKKYVKIVDKALKDYKKKEEEKAEKIRKEEEEKIIRARQSLKRRKQKERRAQRYREAVIDVFADSINEAKKRRKAHK